MKTKTSKAFATFAMTVTVLLMAATGARAQSAFSNAIINLGPVAYWPLQETTPPPAPNVETNLGSLGSVANAYYASTNVQGQAQLGGSIDGGYPFSGITGDSGNVGVDFAGTPTAFMVVPTTDSRVSLPAGKPFSVETWVFFNNVNEIASLVSQTGPVGGGGLNQSANAAGWSLNVSFAPRLCGVAGAGNNVMSTNSLLGFSFHVFNGVGVNGGAEADAGNYYGTNQWYHIVGVFDGTNCALYVDGTNDTAFQTPINGSFTPDTWDPIMFGVSHGLDSGGSSPAPPYAYKGGMTDVAIYTNALTFLQVSNDYQYGYVNPPAGNAYTNFIFVNNNPYMFWQMGAPAYTVPPTNTYPKAINYGSDADPNINGLYQPGTLPGSAGPQFSGMGSANKACAFNDLNAGVMVWTNGSQLSSPLNQTNKSLSLLFWFKGNPADCENGFQGLVSHGSGGWHMSFDQTGHLHWTANGSPDLVSTWPYNDGNWHFVAGVYTNTGAVGPGGFGWTATNLLYVDGRLDNFAFVTNNQTTGITNAAITIGGDPSFLVADLGINTYNQSQRYFGGSLSHVAYFTSALTASQISSLYTTANPNQTPYIIAQPVTGRTITGGSTNYQFIYFGVVANGSPSLAYQWYFNTSSNYTGATSLSDSVAGGTKYNGSQTLQVAVSNLVNSDSGYYYVVVSNPYGSVTSSLASMFVDGSPVITSQTPSGPFSMYTNQTATLSVTANGEVPLTYQWFTNGVADTTAGTASTYFAVATANNETYYCQVSNASGSTNSQTSTATLLFLPATVLNSSYSSNVLAMGATGYWPMHEKETQPLIGDVETNYGTWGAIGNAFYQDWAQATVNHNAPGAIAGSSDGSVAFYNVNNDALLVPHSSPQLTIGANHAPFALEAWVEPFADNTASIGSYMVIMGQGAVGNAGLNGTANQSGFCLQYGGTPSTFSLVTQNGVGSANFEQKTFPVFPPGQWYHIVCFWSGSTNLYYINGQLVNMQSPNASDNPVTLNPDVCAPFSIGSGRWGGSGGSHPFIGNIDEVAVYTNITSQSQAQILAQNDYAAGTSVSSNYFQTVESNQPVLYFRMDAPGYTQPAYSAMTAVLTNYGSAAQNGVYAPSAIPNGAMGPNASGKLSPGMSGTNAMLGNGVMSFADAGITPQWIPGGVTNAFSFSAWIRGNPVDERTFNQVMSANDGTWRSYVDGNGANGGTVTPHGFNDLTAVGVDVNDGGWHQFVLAAGPVYTNNVWNGTVSNAVYVDGVFINGSSSTSSNNPAAKPGPEVLLGDEWGETNDITEGNGGRSFAGAMCEAAYFNGTMLNASQVEALYNSADMAPSIVQQPVSGVATVSLTFTNTVVASGAQPLYYQWYFTNGAPYNYTNVIGATTNGVLSPITIERLTINPVLFTNAGSYYVVVTNAYGAVTSSIVTLAVFGAPVITNQLPVTYTNILSTNYMTLYAGVSPSFVIQAAGAPTLSYYWYTNNVLDGVLGSTKSTATFTNVQSAFTNFCVVSNFLGTATSAVWVVSIVPDPVGAGNTGLAPYPQWVITNHPYAYWRLNEAEVGSGDDFVLANDYAGGNNGMYTNVVLGNTTTYDATADPSDTSALFGSPIVQNSDAESIMAPDFTTTNGANGEFTVSAWIYPTAVQTTTAGIIAKGLFNQEEFDLDCGATGESPRFEVRNAAGTVANANSTNSLSNTSNLNQWYHVVGVCDEANGLVSFYMNGALVGTAAIPANSGIFNSSTTPISIGARSSHNPTYVFGDNDQQFQGYINDVAIFNYAMNSNQVQQSYLNAGDLAPYFYQTPASTNFTTANTNLVISPVLVGGTGPMTNWWTLLNNGTPVSNVFTGVTNGILLNANLIVNNVPGSWNGDQLELNVSNAFGGTNLFVSLVVATNPIITTNLPPSVTLLSGRYYTYQVAAIGAQPLFYQWYENGAGISGQTSPAYSFVAGSAATNTYYVVVTNMYASATSVVSTVTVVGSYQSMVLSSQPAAYWPLDETPDNNAGDDGTVAHDISGNGNNAVYTNAEIGLQGIIGDPFTVAGFGVFSNTYSMAQELVANPDMSQLAAANNNNAEFSVEVWVNGSAQAVNNRIVDQGHFFAEEWALDLGTTTPSDAFRFTVRNAGGTEFDARSTVVPDGNWHQLVGVCDQVNSSLLLYVDGVLAATNNFDTGFAAGGGMEEDPQPITIGNGDASSTGTGQYTPQFIGLISDVAVYTNVLSPSQILSHYQAVTSGVYPIPVITNQLPVPYTNLFTLYAGVSPTYQVMVTGVPPLSYQWYSNGVAVASATNNALTLNKVQTGFYTNYCIITNAEGSTTSFVWTASVVADPTNQYTATLLTNNPVAYWRLNEASGTIANDYAGGANGLYGSGTVGGQPGTPLGGLANELGVYMNNQASSVRAGCITNAGIILNTNAATFVCWVYPTSGAENNPSGLIFARIGTNTVSGSQIGGGNAFDYTWNALATTYNYGSALVVPANTWSFTALTITPTNAILYVFNTNSVRSATNSVANAVQSFYNGLTIGADPQSTSRIFQGEMDEAAVFNYTMSFNQLTNLYFAATNGTVNFPSFTTPPPITFSFANNSLSLNWPSKYVGYYYLQVETNNLSTGISNNWVPYGGSVAATLNAPGITNSINITNGCVFYRLMTNGP